MNFNCSGCACTLTHHESINLGRCVLCREDDRLKKKEANMKYEIEIILKRGIEHRRHALVDPEIVDICTYEFANEKEAWTAFDGLTDILLLEEE